MIAAQQQQQHQSTPVSRRSTKSVLSIDRMILEMDQERRSRREGNVLSEHDRNDPHHFIKKHADSISSIDNSPTQVTDERVGLCHKRQRLFWNDENKENEEDDDDLSIPSPPSIRRKQLPSSWSLRPRRLQTEFNSCLYSSPESFDGDDMSMGESSILPYMPL